MQSVVRRARNAGSRLGWAAAPACQAKPLLGYRAESKVPSGFYQGTLCGSSGVSAKIPMTSEIDINSSESMKTSKGKEPFTKAHSRISAVASAAEVSSLFDSSIVPGAIAARGVQSFFASGGFRSTKSLLASKGAADGKESLESFLARLGHAHHLSDLNKQGINNVDDLRSVLKGLSQAEAREELSDYGLSGKAANDVYQALFPPLFPPASRDEFVSRVVAVIREIRPRKLSYSKLNTEMKEMLGEKVLSLPLDARGGACDSFVRDFLDPFLSHQVPDAAKPGSEGGGAVPISVTFGAPGTGKTTLLFMLTQKFLEHFGSDAVPLFITFNGGMDQEFDEDEHSMHRVYFRILGAMMRSSVTSLEDDTKNINAIGKALGFSNFKSWEFLDHVSLVEIALQLYGPNSKICVFGDELRKVKGNGLSLTEVSQPAVNAMKAILNLSQLAAWLARHDQKKSPIIFGCVSALTCLDPVHGLSEGSQRPCIPIPLPPAVLNAVDKDEWWLEEGTLSDEARTLRRMVLWVKQANISEFKKEVALHKKEAVHEKNKKAYFEHRLREAKRTAGESGNIKAFFEACSKDIHKISGVTPTSTVAESDEYQKELKNYLKSQQRLLVTNLFWPWRFKTERPQGIGAFGDQMKPSIRADTTQLGAIFRDHKLVQDSTYIHPLMLKSLLDHKHRIGDREEKLAADLPIGELKKLCDNICEVPKQPRRNCDNPGVGKAYEELIFRAYLLRIALCPETAVRLDKLLLGKEVSDGPDILRTKVMAGPGLPLKDHFEALRRRKKFEKRKFCFPRSPDQSCSPMPPTGDNALHYVSPSDFHQFCTVSDSLIQIPVDPSSPRTIPNGILVISFGLQNKEYKLLSKEQHDTLQEKRLQQLQWKQIGDAEGRVAEYLSRATFVNVVVTPNEPQGQLGRCREFFFVPDSKSKTEASQNDIGCVRGYEIVVTHDDIRTWSPMVAHSGCDAWVLNMK